MSETKTYQGGCHCGNVRYRFEGTLDTTYACNCSICGKSGTRLAFIPKESFTLEKGEDAMTDYQFAKKNIHHLFCSTCGVRSFGRGIGPDGKEMAAVNVRCLDDVDAEKLPVEWFDGKSL